ncbi:RNA-binding protein 28 [Melospiza georgiana]|uniref:RNA-binding protein 28 n=1 Tax=Melospiza georgiana TaxID=44398 RepID=UPI0025AC5EC9|nr:RNA-binding protein 28 [Melospiza georgiana]
MAAPEARTVLVRGLPAGATAALLERLFGHLGPLRRCFVVTEKGSPKCRGFGYVTFSLAEDAARALREPPELGGHRLPVSPARPRARPAPRGADTPGARGEQGEAPPGPPRAKRPRAPSRKARLILRNLSFQCSEEELRALFAPFGPVVELNLPRKPDGTPRGFAFVQLRNLREAAAALRGLNGAQLKGRPLAVDWAVAKDKYQGTQGPPKTPEGKEKGEGKKEMEEEEEEEEEEDEGKDEENEEEEEEEEEEEAAQAPRQSPKRGSGARAGLGHRKKKKVEEDEDEEDEEEEEQEEDEEKDEDEEDEDEEDEEGEDEDEDDEDEEEEPPRRRQRPSDVAEGRTVFIRNLSFDTEEEELEESLAKFGGLCYVRLVLHPNTGTPKGSAFAQFETPEGAQKCIQAAQEGPEGGGLRLGGRQLRVDPALSREQARGLPGGSARPRGGTRNLYLAREGAIRPGSRAAEGVSDSDMAKRARFEELKRRRLQDPNVAVSRTRLCLHNLPKALDSARLRALLRQTLRGTTNRATPRITECRVMRELRGQGKSLGFAFVEFGEHEEALGALRRLNNNPELFGAHKRPIVEFALEDRRKLRLREQRIQRGLLKAKAKAAAGAPEAPPEAQAAPHKGHPAPPAGSGAPPAAPQPHSGTPWAGFRTQGPGLRGAPGTRVLALPSHRGPKIRKRDKGKKAPPPPKPPKAPKASRRREKPRVPPPQGQRRRRGGPGGAEARFQELVERYKRKILGSNPPTARGGKWFES